MTGRPSPRRLARELVLQALYATGCRTAGPDESFAEITGDSPLAENNRQFARRLFDLTLAHREWADQQIARLSENWDIRRIATVDRTILQMSLVELEHMPDTPVKVVINEAIELARKFSTAESAAYVNGILDAYIHGPDKVREQ
ncbi:MAG: transcription antitermination factor NusB [Candidatus Zixiibacteriota bacterium]